MSPAAKENAASIVSAKEVLHAYDRISPHIAKTPLIRSAILSDETGGEIFLKLENLQYTGSFKLRGAVNRVMAMSEAERSRGIVTASSGNHGAAVALALQKTSCSGRVFVPEGTSPLKVSRIEQLGVPVIVHGADGIVSEEYAREFARETNQIYISPYNDPHVVAGQGTIAVEIEKQHGMPDAIVAAVGGGGLISGIGAYAKQQNSELFLVGASPQHSPVMIRSIESGHVIEMESLPTLSDGTAGGVEADSITFESCQRLVDTFHKIPENDIAANMRSMMIDHHLVVEGAAAVAVAAVRNNPDLFKKKVTVIVICGGNLDVPKLRSVLN